MRTLSKQDSDLNKNNDSVIDSQQNSFKEKLLQSQLKFLENQKISWRNTYVKWIALTFGSAIMFGVYTCYDFPAFLQIHILEDMLGQKDGEDESDGSSPAMKKYGWFYSIYSLPNIILPLFGGFFVDKFGVRKGLLIFSVLLFLGQSLCMNSGFLAGSFSSPYAYIYMLLGRFIFALGGENLSVAQATLISKWFRGKQLAFALCTTLSFQAISSVATGWILDSLYNIQGSLTIPLLYGVIGCVLALLSVIGLNYLDKKADIQEGKETQFYVPDISEQIKVKDILKFPYLYWLLTLISFLNYICLYTFIQFSQGFLTSRYQVAESVSNRIVTIPYLMSAFLAPLFGFLVDVVGNRQWMLFTSSLLNMITHCLWVLLPQCPLPNDRNQCYSIYYYLPSFTLGLMWSIFLASSWPCIPIVLEKSQTGTGYGFYTSIYNAGLFIAPLILGEITTDTKQIDQGYFYMCIFFIICAVLQMIVALLILIENKKQNNILGKNASIGEHQSSFLSRNKITANSISKNILEDQNLIYPNQDSSNSQN